MNQNNLPIVEERTFKTLPSGHRTAVPFGSLSWPKTYLVEAQLTVLEMLDEADVDELCRRLESSGEKLESALARYVHLGLDADAKQTPAKSNSAHSL
ncbi:hypothetical protein [Terriglobus sp.]|uniref:hypothetical protein n=1 Tax=Terriglobus sp. TaxID=1889013 RepID=UPI003B008FC9